MARRWRDPAAFLVDPAASSGRPPRRQAIALLVVLVLVAAGAAAASWLVAPSRAQAFDLFSGSLYINDVRAPVAVDLATGKPTVRLRQANEQVGARTSSDLAVYPLTEGTLLLNRSTGEFNMVDSTGFVTKLTGGVPLPARSGDTTSIGVASGSMAYILRSGVGATDVYLVGQATVQAAEQPGAAVQPRAFRTVLGRLVGAESTAVAANGDLWLVADTAGGRRVLHLHLPAGSRLGARLGATSSPALTGPVALGTVAGPATGDDVVAVASGAGIELVQPDGHQTTLRFPAIAGLDRLLPVTGETEQAQFLFHGTDGWGLLTAERDGRSGVQRAALRDVATSSDLATPAASGGQAYTLDRTTGRVLRIATDGATTGFATYKVVSGVETRDFGDAYLVARGPRVVVDSPNHIYALTVFTDRPGTPVHVQPIDKNAAVDVNASGGAEAIARAHGAPAPPTPGATTSRPKDQPSTPAPPPAQTPVQPINNAIACENTTQTPHRPAFTRIDPGSRSLHLEWRYPKLDAQDCVPSTYLVGIELVTPGAPAPQSGSVRVQGERAVNVVGLFPSTQYRLTLTALIGDRGAHTDPTMVTTGPEGPAAPTGVTAAVTPSGDWTLTWHSCGSVAQGCVPAASWDVLPSYCDGRGLSDPLGPITVVGDPTLRTFTTTVTGGGALLGRSLRFRVVGHGEDGTVGTLSDSSACLQSWRTPSAAGVEFEASAPAPTQLGSAGIATITVNLGPNPTAAVGGFGGGVRFQLTGPEGTVTKGPIAYDGTRSIIAASFDGVRAGATYTATAFLVPPGHPEAAVQLESQQVSTSAQWPAALAVRAQCPTPSGVVRLRCDLTVGFVGLSSADARGELFDLTDQSRLQCGERAQPLTRTGFDPGSATITESVSLLNYHGTCTVYAQLVESSGTPAPAVFGGTVSRLLSVPVDLGAASTLDAGSGDFAVAWDGPPGSHVIVRYTGDTSDEDVDTLTQNWQETVLAPDGTACGGDDRQPTHAGITVDPTPRCINQQGDRSGWQVRISYDDAGTATTHTVTESLDGPPPGYVPCTVDVTAFAATWTGTAAAPAAELAFTGTDSDLAGCDQWTYQVRTLTTTACGDGPQDTAPAKAEPVDVNLTCADPPAVGWTMHVGYERPDGTPASFDLVITGQVPQ